MRSLPLYHPIGGKSPTYSPNSVREKVCWNVLRIRCTAVLLIVAFSLTTLWLLTIDGVRWNARLAPFFSAPPSPTPSNTSSSYSGSPSSPFSSTPQNHRPQFPPPSAHLLDQVTYDSFLAPDPAHAMADMRIRPIQAHARMSDACIDAWVSTGRWGPPCKQEMGGESMIDLVYVWVNGSDPLHAKSRSALLDKTKYRAADSRFREHEELRYNLRAARNATASWRGSMWHIVTAGIASPEPLGKPPADSRQRLGLVPQWLDIKCAVNGYAGLENSDSISLGHGRENTTNNANGRWKEKPQPPIFLQHDAQIFRFTSDPSGTPPSPNDAQAWLDRVLPSFNSFAVESQLPHLDPEVVSENIVALNDDQFMLLPMPPSGFHTTLYGPVFRMDPNLLVGGDASGRADGGGEWRSLGWSAHLLNERFGERKRPYMQHNARALSLPLLHEASLAFGQFFAHTPFSQFRGSHNTQGELEVNTIFLSTHFVVERHREALLWSWVIGKWGVASGKKNSAGHTLLDAETKRAMWREIGGVDGEHDQTLRMGMAERTTKEDIDLNLLTAGVQPPQAIDSTRQGDTTYTWVSIDGFSSNFHALAKDIAIRRNECIGAPGERAWDMFRRLAKENSECGDNIIAGLMHSSKSGLGVFLPTPSSPSSPDSDPLILPLILPADPPPLPSNPRRFASRLIQRYAYVLGDSPTEFLRMTSVSATHALLRNMDMRPEVALMCINDDLSDNPRTLKDADKALKDWFERRWPQPLRCEV